MHRRVFAVLTALLVALAVAALPAGASTGRRLLPNSTASFLKGLKPLGATSSTTKMRVAVTLGLRNEAGVQTLFRQVSDPKSPQFRQFPTSQQFINQYSPAQSDVDAVVSWLKSQGLRVGAVPVTRLIVPATGTAAQIESAFGVKLNNYSWAGQTISAPAGTPSVPASLNVAGVAGLTSISAHTATIPPPPAYVVGKPCSAYWGQEMAAKKPSAYGTKQPFIPCGYTPQQMQSVYGLTGPINNGADGHGWTVGIIDAFSSPWIQQDLDQYSSLHSLPQQTITQINDPPNPAQPPSQQQGWWGEETLDVEAVHSLAPQASIVYRGASDGKTPSMLIALNDMVGNDRANIITNSWGYLGESVPVADMNSFNDVFLMAACTGITLTFSSGDEGDDSYTKLGYVSTDFPPSNPLVVAVGGTSVGVDALGMRSFETGWGTMWAGQAGSKWSPKPPGIEWYGSGGGTSRVFAEPFWQVDAGVPTSLSGMWGGANRVVPDVAMDGDPNTGFLVGQTQTFPTGVMYGEYRIGGTSLSSPLFAATLADAGSNCGSCSYGLITPYIYEELYNNSNAFLDITPPTATIASVRSDFLNGVDASAGKYFSLRTMNMDASLKVTTGYDNVTGVGVPNGQNFINAFSP
jgi:subtilase family serine protease